MEMKDLAEAAVGLAYSALLFNDRALAAEVATLEGRADAGLGIEAIADLILERWFTVDYRKPDNAEFAGYRNMLIRTPREGYTATCAAIRDTDYTEAARLIKVPAMCVVGTEDGSTPPELVGELSRLIPGALYQEIPGAGHLPCIEQPVVLTDAIKLFVQKIAAEGK